MLAAGALCSTAFPELDLTPVMWVGIVPLLWALQGAGGKRGAGLGFLFGLGFFATLLTWVSIIGVLGWVVLSLLQASFVAVFGAVWGRLSLRAGRSWERIVIPALLWVLLVEGLRSVVPVVGFTWGQIAQSQHDMTWLLKAASVGGSWLVAGLVVACNASILQAATAAARRQGRGAAAFVLLALLILVSPALIPAASADGDELRVAIVQGNIPRYMEPSYSKDLEILDNHLRLTSELAGRADLIVWPESSVAEDPFIDETFRRALSDAAQASGAPMIVGGNIERDDGKYQVMAFQVASDGRIVDQYHKTHLVPFGEYVPARSLFDWIPALAQVPRDAVPGAEVGVFDINGKAVAPVISFEADFGSLVRRRMADGGRLLVVATNTSTWEDSWASAQHVAMSQVRAAENGVFVVHAALTGISAFIAPDGTVLDATDLWRSQTLIRDVRMATTTTLYSRWGDWVCWVALVVVVSWVATTRLRRRDRGDRPHSDTVG